MIRSLAPFMAIAPLLLATACVRPETAEAPAPPPVAAAPPPPPAPVLGWTERPVTPGAWTYRAEPGGGTASFADGGPALLALRCAAGDVTIMAAGAQRIDIATTTVARSFAPGADGAAHIPPRDTFLDALAFSRGRIRLTLPPRPELVLPVQAEIGRVVEDCRG